MAIHHIQRVFDLWDNSSAHMNYTLLKLRKKIQMYIDSSSNWKKMTRLIAIEEPQLQFPVLVSWENTHIQQSSYKKYL